MTLAATAKSQSLPTFIVPTAAALFFFLGIGPNILMALLSCVVLAFGVFLLWRPGEAQILLYLFIYQWLQASLFVFYANLSGLPLTEFAPGRLGLQPAVLLALLGLMFLSVGIRLGAGSQQGRYISATWRLIARQPQIRWLQLYLAALGIATVAQILAVQMPGLSQPLLALANIKWGAYLILSISTFARRDSSRALWLAVFCAEFAMSLGGYFSTFKFVFLYTLIAIGAAGVRLSLAHITSIALCCAVALLSAVYWTAIKTEYRGFVSGYGSVQAVVVDREEAIGKLIELVSETRSHELIDAMDNLARRTAEIEIFGAVVEYVPAVVPHQGGKIWLESILRPFMPRLLFPDKAIIDETELTNNYTGRGYAGMAEGTQVGMGYIADAYIDFGEIGMMGALLLFGCFVGYLYRWFIRHPYAYGLLGSGLASSTLMQMESLGFSSAKVVGGIVVSALVSVLFLNLVVPRYMRWLRD